MVNSEKGSIGNSLIIVLYFLSILILMMSENIFFYWLFLLIMIGIGYFGLFFYLIIQKRIKQYEGKVLVLLFFITFISNIYTRNQTLNGMILYVSLMGGGLLLVHTKLNYYVMIASFYFHVMIMSSFVVSRIHPDFFFLSYSRNFISIILLIQLVLLYISYEQNRRRVSIVPAFLALPISAWAIGRSGILAIFMLFALLLFYKVRTTQFRIPKDMQKDVVIIGIVSCFIIAIGGLIIPPMYDTTMMEVLGFTRFAEMGIVDPHRMAIWSEYTYLTGNSIGNIIMGASFRGNEVLQRYGYSLHNSILNVHATGGLAKSIVMALLIILTIKRYIKERSYIYLILAGILIFRMSTDSIPYMNPLIYFFLLEGRVEQSEISVGFDDIIQMKSDNIARMKNVVASKIQERDFPKLISGWKRKNDG